MHHAALLARPVPHPEVMILMAGWLPDPSTTVAVMGICINTSGIVWVSWQAKKEYDAR